MPPPHFGSGVYNVEVHVATQDADPIADVVGIVCLDIERPTQRVQRGWQAKVITADFPIHDRAHRDEQELCELITTWGDVDQIHLVVVTSEVNSQKIFRG